MADTTNNATATTTVPPPQENTTVAVAPLPPPQEIPVPKMETKHKGDEEDDEPLEDTAIAKQSLFTMKS